MTHPPRVGFAGTLSPTAQPVPDKTSAERALSWYVTGPLGHLGGGMYTEVAFAPGAVDPLQTHLDAVAVARVLDEVVRLVAFDLYGTRWAFTYPPDQYDDAIARWNLHRRELVIVTAIDVYDSNPREDTRP